jgi:hypothetical protein
MTCLVMVVLSRVSFIYPQLMVFHLDLDGNTFFSAIVVFSLYLKVGSVDFRNSSLYSFVAFLMFSIFTLRGKRNWS